MKWERKCYDWYDRNTKDVIHHYYEKLYANKFDSLEEMNQFLETHNLPRQNHEEIKTETDY